MDCFVSFLALGSFVLSIIALARSGGSERLQRELQALRKELEELKRRTAPSAASVSPASEPVVPEKAAEPLRPQASPQPRREAPAQLPPEPVRKPEPMPPLVPTVPVAPVVQEPAIPKPVVKPAPERTVVVAPPVPPPARIERAPIPRPVPRPASPPARSWTLEDLLGTQVFLKLGIAILVIGVVFAMGLVFQKVGELGKVAMGYGAGLAILGGGLYAERRERYRTFGRTLIAGAWGILYFVTYAAGFLEAARVFDSRVAAVVALILAAGAAVAFSLRYRNEWTTTSAFLLIFLSLGISALESLPDFNLTATLVVACAMSVLVWRLGWVKLLGLGVFATWVSLALWRLEGGLGLLLGYAGCWAAFQGAAFSGEDTREHRSWKAFAQISNFVGALGLTLIAAQPLHRAWGWALAYGLAHLGVAWLHRRKGNRGLYLLTATEAIAALALVTPLRLGLKDPLTPLMRLLGIELLLAAGVFLRERYFRILAYGAFALTVLEVLVLRMAPSLGDQRLVMLGATGALALLNAALLRVWWKEECASELPALPWGFTAIGALFTILFVWIRVPSAWMGATFAALACLWLWAGLTRGLRDLVLEGSVLGACALGSLLAAEGSLASALGGSGLLVAAYGLTRRLKGRDLPASWTLGLTGLFSFLMTAALATVLIQEVPAPGVAPALGGLAVILLLAGVLLGYRELVYEAWLADGIALVTLVTHAGACLAPLGPLAQRAWSILGVVLAAIVQEGIFRRRSWKRLTFLDRERTSGIQGLCHGASLLLAVVIYLEAPQAWQASLLSLLAAGHLALGLRLKDGSHVLASLWLSALVLQALGVGSWRVAGHWHGIPVRALSMGFPVLSFLLQEELIRRYEAWWPWSDDAAAPCRNGHAILAAGLLAVVVGLEAPAPWMSPCFMLLGILWMLWAQGRASALHCFESLGFCLLGFLTMATHTADLEGDVLGVPARLVSALGSLASAYVIQYLLERSAREIKPDRVLLTDRMRPGMLVWFGAGLLTLTSLVLGYWIKLEALAHDKNLLVTLAWGLLGVAYLERGRASKVWSWVLHGHLGLLAALCHFLVVNIPQTGELGFLSLRVITGLPFLGFMVYAYLYWPELDRASGAPPSAGRWRSTYLYGVQLVVAMLLLYEPHRAWVLPLWALQALASLLWGLRKENAHWLRSALILAVACGFRGIGSNLYFRDQVEGLALNLLAVPLAALLLLAGYILLRRRLEGAARLDLEGLGAGSNRLPWLLLQALLFFGFIWVEASGPKLTVWLSAFGLGMVVLGFVFQERVARLTGLGILSACILKLFFFDLRGLQGLPRVLSFIVLGLVLISVSYSYTRFKERLDKLL